MNDSDEKSSSCLVLMPFDRGLINLWDAVIRPAVRSCGMRPVRPDEELKAGDNVMAQVRREIMASEVVVAVMIGNGSYVHYALGLAHAAKKRVLMLKEKGREQPVEYGFHHFLEYDPENFPLSREALVKTLNTIRQAGQSEDFFPELVIQDSRLMAEYEYLKQIRKTLTVRVTPEVCSIFFNNSYLGQSPQTFSVNPEADKPSTISVAAAEHFEFYKVLTAQDIENGFLNIELEIRDSKKFPEKVHEWLMLRRKDPENPVLSLAIARYLIDKRKLDQAREEVNFCISKFPVVRPFDLTYVKV